MTQFLVLAAFAVAALADTASGTIAAHDRDGQIALSRGRYMDAKAHFEQALSLIGTDAPAEVQAPELANLGQACQELGDLSRAEHLYRQALERTPEVGALWNLLGGVLVLKGRYAGAERAEHRAIELGGEGVALRAQNALAVILEARGKIREAAALVEQVIPGTPPGQARARLLANLGGLNLKLGRRHQAVEFLQRSLIEMEGAVGATHPDLARILDVYGKALQASGRKKQAMDLFSRAQEIRSSFAVQANAAGLVVDYRDLR